MMDLINILGLSLLGSVVALVGGVVVLMRRGWAETLERFAVPFAAGVLLTVALVGLLPEAVHSLGEVAYVGVLVSFLGAFVFEHVVCDLHHHEHGDGCGAGGSGSVMLVLVGDTLHNFVDGVAIAAAYLVDPGLGVAATMSTFLHEVPHEIGDFGVLLRAGWGRGKVLVANTVSALATLVGAVVAWVLAGEPEVVGWLLVVSGGMFLYLGASDFLPHVGKGEKKPVWAMLALLVGVGVMIGTLKAVPHEHGEHEEEEGHALVEEIDGEKGGVDEGGLLE